MHGWGKHRTWRKLHLMIEPASGDDNLHYLGLFTVNGGNFPKPIAGF